MKIQSYLKHMPICMYFKLHFLKIDQSLIFYKSLKIVRKKIFLTCKRSYGHSTNWFIRQINFIFLQWFNEWKNIFQRSKIKQDYLNHNFIFLDNWIFNKQFHYINRKHSNRSLLWKIQNYFGPFNPYKKNFWVFGDKFSSLYSIRIIWIFDH